MLRAPVRSLGRDICYAAVFNKIEKFSYAGYQSGLAEHISETRFQIAILNDIEHYRPFERCFPELANERRRSSKQIAERLGIAKNTVDTHRRNLLRKTGAKNTPAPAIRVMQEVGG